MAIFYRHDQDHGFLDVHRVNWKDTVEELRGNGGAFLKKSLAKMVATVIAMSERK
uniref:Glutathione S-transferase n=1 Tax=Steinernema glaseri TaxID=37863 RepID=A0A1I7Z8H8_9BILA